MKKVIPSIISKVALNNAKRKIIGRLKNSKKVTKGITDTFIIAHKKYNIDTLFLVPISKIETTNCTSQAFRRTMDKDTKHFLENPIANLTI
jgi:beta-N-acetylglucosaminidase